VSWRTGSRRAFGSREFTVIVALGATALGLGCAMSPAGARPLGAASSGPATAVVYQVSAAAQRGTLAYWTPGRRAQIGLAAARAGTRPGTRSGALPQAAAGAAAPPKGTPTAVHFTGVPTAGALFSTMGGQSHFCTADTVQSTVGDLVITAAHCVDGNSGFATNIEYVPEYHNGHTPYGAWTVESITVAAGWQKSEDPDLDFAFLAVGAARGPKIQSVTGGLTLGFTRQYKETIEVIGYNDTDTEPIRCLTKSFKFRDNQMEFYCHGFWTGTSGGPWVIGYNAKTGTGTVFGGIGGYEKGGRYEWASYSPYFSSQLRALFQQAETGPSPTPSPSPSPSASPSPTPSATSS
jgi:V8-like Glu-specific endopeptidase